MGTGTAQSALVVTTLASGLDIPWGMAFVPDGRLFVTERPGRLRVIVAGVLQPAAVVTLPVEATGEGGLLGLAADPGFATNGHLYVYYTYRSGANLFNRVARLAVTGSSAVQDRVLLEGIPGASNHDGGRIKVGPDGLLYVTTGDAGNSSLSQDQGSLASKILRMTRDGAVPPGNPFPSSYVYTLGHRNPQGLAWDSSGTLYATEHGPSSNDEVNRVGAGLNYGWPTIVGSGGTAPFVRSDLPVFPGDLRTLGRHVRGWPHDSRVEPGLALHVLARRAPAPAAPQRARVRHDRGLGGAVQRHVWADARCHCGAGWSRVRVHEQWGR